MHMQMAMVAIYSYSALYIYMHDISIICIKIDRNRYRDIKFKWNIYLWFMHDTHAHCTSTSWLIDHDIDRDVRLAIATRTWSIYIISAHCRQATLCQSQQHIVTGVQLHRRLQPSSNRGDQGWWKRGAQLVMQHRHVYICMSSRAHIKARHRIGDHEINIEIHMRMHRYLKSESS